MEYISKSSGLILGRSENMQIKLRLLFSHYWVLNFEGKDLLLHRAKGRPEIVFEFLPNAKREGSANSAFSSHFAVKEDLVLKQLFLYKQAVFPFGRHLHFMFQMQSQRRWGWAFMCVQRRVGGRHGIGGQKGMLTAKTQLYQSMEL